MTVAIQIAFDLRMPDWLDAIGLVSVEQWAVFTQYLNFTVTIGMLWAGRALIVGVARGASPKS